MESGQIIKTLRESFRIIEKLAPMDGAIFYSKEEYVEEYTIDKAMEMNDFSFVYILYLFWTVALVVRLLHRSIATLLIRFFSFCPNF